MANEVELPSEPRGKARSIYVFWGLGLGLLALIAGFMEYVYQPCREVREALELYEREKGPVPEDWNPSPSRLAEWKREQQAARRSAVQKLGGPRAAGRKLALYARLPARWAPGQLLIAELSGECEDPVRILTAMLGNSEGYVRDRAVVYLMAVGDRRAVEPLIGALKDRDISVVCSAATALGEIRDPRAISPLRTLLGDSRQGVREAAQRALARIEVISPANTGPGRK